MTVTNCLGRGVVFAAMVMTGFAAVAGSALETIDDVRVGPLVQSKWDQMYAGGNSSGGEKCYNYHTPNQSYCGCGPTCFAQIMRYHEWPQTPVDTHSLVYDFDGLTKKVKQVDGFDCTYMGSKTNMTMIGGSYDWSKMPYETKLQGTPEAEREMIGRLCYDLGVSMSSAYNRTSGTGTSSPAAVHALPGNFHYADAAAVEWNLTANMRTYDFANLERALIPCLDAGLPCALMIDGSGKRHIIVCDGYGYQNGILYLHLNVGYSGLWNGWYPVEGDWAWTISGIDYTSVAGIVYNISPSQYGPVVSGHVVTAAGAPVVGAAVSVRRDGVTVTNLVTNARGGYVYKVAPGDYDVTVSKGSRSHTTRMTLRPCRSTAYLQTGDYLQTPVAVDIANKVHENLLLDDIPQSAAPTSIPGDGASFLGSQTVELYSATEGAEIRYTLDGSIPDRDSPLYVEPFVITEVTTVRAIAFKEGEYPSEISTFRFIESSLGDILGCPDTPWSSGGYGQWYADDYEHYTLQEYSELYGKLRSAIPPWNMSGLSKSSWLEATIDGPAKVSFDYYANLYTYCTFTVVLDGTATNVTEKGYTSYPQWKSADPLTIPAGRHTLRFDNRVGGSGSQGLCGVHLRNMRIIYPNVLKAVRDSGNVSWSTMSFTDGERSDTWAKLQPSNPRVTVSAASQRTITVDTAATLDVLTLNGPMTFAAVSGGCLTVGRVSVNGAVTLGTGALSVTERCELAAPESTIVVPTGSALVPVSVVPGSRVVAQSVAGGTLYALAVAYVSPFSARPVGSVNWSAMTFTDNNNNQADWATLQADASAKVTLNVASEALVNLTSDVPLRSLLVTGDGDLTLKSTMSKCLTAEAATVSANLTLSGACATLGAVTLAEGKTLSVPSADSFSSIKGAGTLAVGGSAWPSEKGLSAADWTGTLRLTGLSYTGACDQDEISNPNSQLIFSGKLLTSGELRISRQLTVTSDAVIQGDIVLTDLAARVFVESGAAVSPMASGVQYYKVEATQAEGGSVYSLVLDKLTYVGPFEANLAVAAVKWSEITWTDSRGQPGTWSQLEAGSAATVTIIADQDVVITMDRSEKVSAVITRGKGKVTLLYPNSLAVPAEMLSAFRAASWKGAVRLQGSRTMGSVDFGDYGNAGSSIELDCNITCSLKSNGRCDAALKLESSSMVKLNSGTKGSTYVFAGALSGSGEFYFSGTCSERLCFSGDATAFRGCISAAYGRTLIFGDPQGRTYDDNCVVVNSEVTFANLWHAVVGKVYVSGKATIESGAKISAQAYMGSPATIVLASPGAQVLVKNSTSYKPISGVSGREVVTVRDGNDYLYSIEPDKPEPSIEDAEYVGSITQNEAGEYVVTFHEQAMPYLVLDNVTDQTIVVPQNTLYVMGVPKDNLRIRYGLLDLTEAFAFEGSDAEGYMLMLDGDKSVQVGDQLISVRPELATEDSPLTVGETVGVEVRSIPGLTYRLLRSEEVSGVTGGEAVATEQAQGRRLSLVDPQKDNKPSKAFYAIEVVAE